MKSFLIFFVLTIQGTVSSCLDRHGWTPTREFLYRFETQVLTGIPEIRTNQHGGVRLATNVRIQTDGSSTLVVRFEDAGMLKLNGDVRFLQSGRLSKGSLVENFNSLSESKFRDALEKPFVVQLHRGVVQSYKTLKDESESILNIRRAFLSLIQLNIRAGRVDFNATHAEANLDLREPSYYKINESTILGNCLITYHVQPVAHHRVAELESDWSREERESFDRDPQKPYQEGQICYGRNYFVIYKSVDLDTCQDSPIYQRVTGVEARCDSSSSNCADQFTHAVSSNCYICGDLDEYVVRRCLEHDILTSNPLTWSTEENIKRTATVYLGLLDETKTFQKIQVDESDLSRTSSLNFEIPPEVGNKPIGLKNVHLSMPNISEGHSPQFWKKQDFTELKRQITDLFHDFSREMSLRRTSCPTRMETASIFEAIVNALVPLNMSELDLLKREIISISLSHPYGDNMRSLLFDVISSIGSNPSFMLVKKEIEQMGGGMKAVAMLEQTLLSLRHPTPDMLREVVKFVKKLRKVATEDDDDWIETKKTLYSVGLVQVSNLFYRACSHPVRRIYEFPTKIYGEFCNEREPLIQHVWIPHLVNEIESPVDSSSSQSEHLRLVAISALGKLGHPLVVHKLANVIQGSVSEKPLIRSVAVYSLKRVARLQPELVRDILMAIIDNTSENSQVRIAAISVLPWAHPTVDQLQKVAMRTWIEPSKQVSSFMHSTFKSLTTTEVPELKAVGEKVIPIMSLMKPQVYGYQFGHNVNLAKFVDYLKSAVSNKLAWSFDEDELVPTTVAVSNKFYNSVVVARGLSFKVYTQGMDYLLQKILFTTSRHDSLVTGRIDHINFIEQDLNMKDPPLHEPTLFLQGRYFGGERMFTITQSNFEVVIDTLIGHTNGMELMLLNGYNFRLSRALQIFQAQIMRPTAAGMMTLSENSLSAAFSVDGSVRTGNSAQSLFFVPDNFAVKVSSVLNVHLHSFVGVQCPFSGDFHGAGIRGGAHLEAPFEVEASLNNGKARLTIKIPDEFLQRPKIEIAHVFVIPYTSEKNMEKIGDLKSQNPIRTYHERKKVDSLVGESFGINGRLEAFTDAKLIDFFPFLAKQQQKMSSMSSIEFLPASVRYTSLQFSILAKESTTTNMTFQFHLDFAKRLGVLSQKHVFQHNYLDNSTIYRRACEMAYEIGSASFGSCIGKTKHDQISLSDSTDICDKYNEIMADIEDQKLCIEVTKKCNVAVDLCNGSSVQNRNQCSTINHFCEEQVREPLLLKRFLKNLNGEYAQMVKIRGFAALGGPFGERKYLGTLSMAKSEEGINSKHVFALKISHPNHIFPYEIGFDVDTIFHEAKYCWKVAPVLSEDIEIKFEGQLKYGFENNITIVFFKSSLEKSRDKDHLLMFSDEWQKCTTGAHKGDIFAQECCDIRYKASFLNKLHLKLEFPTDLPESEVQFMENGLEYFLDGKVTTQQNFIDLENGQVRLMLELTHDGGFVNLELERKNKILSMKNIRLPTCLKTLFPINAREHILEQIFKKIGNVQSGSCRITNSKIMTFDNKTYDYAINDCLTLLYKGRTGVVPVAVMARKDLRSEFFLIEIISGKTQLIINPKRYGYGANIFNMELNNNEFKTIILRSATDHKIEIILKRFQDSVYEFYFPNEMLLVRTDGLNIEISVPQISHGHSVGLCGDYDGEATGDLKTSKQCIMNKEMFAAYTFMLSQVSLIAPQNWRCSGIPPGERGEFLKERQTCLYNAQINTPVKRLYEKLNRLNKPPIMIHTYENNDDKICFSRKPLLLCDPQSLARLTNRFIPDDLDTIDRVVDFTCLDRYSELARSLKGRADAGENLEIDFDTLQVDLTKIVKESILCSSQQFQTSHFSHDNL